VRADALQGCLEVILGSLAKGCHVDGDLEIAFYWNTYCSLQHQARVIEKLEKRAWTAPLEYLEK